MLKCSLLGFALLAAIVEIGEWFAKGKKIENFKIIVGAEKNFFGLRYIEKKFKDEYEGFKLLSSLENMSEEIIEQIKKMI